MEKERRQFLVASVAFGVTALGPLAGHVRGDDKKDAKNDEEEVGAAEDLMREHGVLNRILLIYEEGLRRLRAKEDVPPDVFHKPATLVRKFVEDYHERLEEKFIFPEFEKAKKLADLVKVLKEQHEAGRKVSHAEVAMNWDQVKRNWESVQGKLKEEWGKLTDDDLTAIEGKRDQLAGRLQERYGYGKEQAEREADEFARTLNTP